jgi:hypothetical protein
MRLSFLAVLVALVAYTSATGSACETGQACTSLEDCNEEPLGPNCEYIYTEDEYLSWGFCCMDRMSSTPGSSWALERPMRSKPSTWPTDVKALLFAFKVTRIHSLHFPSLLSYLVLTFVLTVHMLYSPYALHSRSGLVKYLKTYIYSPCTLVPTANSSRISCADSPLQVWMNVS